MAKVRTAEQMQALIEEVLGLPLHQYLGLRLLEAESGTSRLAMFAGERTLNGRGGVNSGLLSTVADVAAAIASFSLLPSTEVVSTIDFHLQMMRTAAPGSEIEAVGRVVKPGRTLFFCESQILADGKLCATARITKVVQETAGAV